MPPRAVRHFRRVPARLYVKWRGRLLFAHLFASACCGDCRRREFGLRCQLPSRLSTSEYLPVELAPETAIVTCWGEELGLSTASPVNCTPLSGA